MLNDTRHVLKYIELFCIHYAFLTLEIIITNKKTSLIMKTIVLKRIILLSAILAFNSFSNVIFAVRKDFFLASTSDSLPIRVSVSTPPAGVNVKAVVQLVHGMCEHK